MPHPGFIETLGHSYTLSEWLAALERTEGAAIAVTVLDVQVQFTRMKRQLCAWYSSRPCQCNEAQRGENLPGSSRA